LAASLSSDSFSFDRHIHVVFDRWRAGQEYLGFSGAVNAETVQIAA
jgi:hypothetical protein